MTNLKVRCHQLLLAVLTLAFFTAAANAQTFTDLHDFDETEGCCASYPSMLVQGQDGNIYGATTSGGAHFYGNIFKMTPSGTLTSIYSFDLTHGGYPQSGISMAADGNFYGTTYQGGTNHYGTIFKVTPSGAFTELYDFANTTDGAYPHTPPVQAQDGNLYGTTANGTVAVLYKITTAGVFTVMETLVGQSYSPLLLGADGNLYGTTVYGGTFNGGTVFVFSPAAKAMKTIYNFHTEYSPYGPLMQGADGALYGTTSSGGTGSGGVVFRVTTAGVYKVLFNFTVSSANGASSYSGLVQGSDKFLYGVTSAGGANGQGVLFKISPTGTGFAVLHDFATATGDTPFATPFLHTNGTIYGLSFHGGAHSAYGVVYSMNAGLKEFVAPVVLHSAKSNTSVELLGQGFNTATGVLFGTGAGALTIASDTFATAKVTTGAMTGAITVKEPGGNLSTLQVFKIVPTIKNFTPTSGTVGTSVVITGTSLLQTLAVKFGGVAATVFTVNSDTQVTATVPTGAVTGKITITTNGGTATSPAVFTVD
jgi:uncharacterized repeat protein (TIGR03803 family)